MKALILTLLMLISNVGVAYNPYTFDRDDNNIYVYEETAPGCESFLADNYSIDDIRFVKGRWYPHPGIQNGYFQLLSFDGQSLVYRICYADCYEFRVTKFPTYATYKRSWDGTKWGRYEEVYSLDKGFINYLKALATM